MKQIIQTKKGNPVFSLIFIVSIAAFAIFLLIVGYIGNLVGTEMMNQLGDSEAVNNSLQTTITTSTVTINSFWYIVFFGLLLGLFISAYMMREYPPVMVPVFLITLVVTVVVAIALANAYGELTEVAQLADATGQQSGIGYIVTKLPYVAVIAGLIAIVIAFVRPGGQGGGGAIIN